MNLADRIVALGISQRGQFPAPDGTTLYYLTGETVGGLTADKFICSWEVAGTLIEKCWAKEFFIQIDRRKELPSITVTLDYNEDGPIEVLYQCGTDSLLSAIILACVEALEANHI